MQAIQNGRCIFTTSLSFQREFFPKPEAIHQPEAPDVPLPALPSENATVPRPAGPEGKSWTQPYERINSKSNGIEAIRIPLDGMK